MPTAWPRTGHPRIRSSGVRAFDGPVAVADPGDGPGRCRPPAQRGVCSDALCTPIRNTRADAGGLRIGKQSKAPADLTPAGPGAAAGLERSGRGLGDARRADPAEPDLGVEAGGV